MIFAAFSATKNKEEQAERAAARKGLFSKPTLTERLIAAALNMDIHVIPEAMTWEYHPTRRIPKTISVADIGKSILVLLATTLIGYVFYAFGFTESNIIAVLYFRDSCGFHCYDKPALRAD